MKTVLIFGGSGFVGRHIIRRIAKNGYKIIIPYQRSVNEAKLRLLGTTGQIILIRYCSILEEKITNLIIKADVILNLKTLWDEKKISFKKGILNFNINLINTIKKIDKQNQFIYFSGLGSDQEVSSRRSDAIYQSEQYIQKNLDNSVIVRPGIIIGGGDQFLKGLLPLFKMSFFIPLFGNGFSKIQPVFVDDVSKAINKIIKTKLLKKHIFEFVGNDIFTYKELYSYLSKCMDKTRVFIPLPIGMVRLGISILEKTPFSSLNSEQLKLFERDNIASNNFKKLTDLEVNPQDLREIIKKIVKINT